MGKQRAACAQPPAPPASSDLPAHGRPAELRLGELSHGSPREKKRLFFFLQAFQGGFSGARWRRSHSGWSGFHVALGDPGGGGGEMGGGMLQTAAAGSNCISQMLIDSGLQLKET